MYGSGEDYDAQDGDADDADNGNGCGGWGGEYYWYMVGFTSVQRIWRLNVSYSFFDSNNVMILVRVKRNASKQMLLTACTVY